MKHLLSAAVASILALASPASAQQSQSGASPSPMMSATVDLPEECRNAGQTGGQGQMMQGMQGQMHGMMQNMQGMMGQMTETQKGLQDAMMKMNPAMMQGMMAKDADVAWICTMIPHHQAAIDMARAGLKGADNTESKQLAEKTIKDNEKSLADLMEWVSKNAKREGPQ